MATGLLVLGIESSTRLLTYVVGLDKEYFATIRLGAATTSDDAEGELIGDGPAAGVVDITVQQLLTQIEALTGEIEQVPSSVSAIKVDGKRAYALVRAGEEVALKSRSVIVSEFELLGNRLVDGYLDVEVRVVCSSGTYIRALARDMGRALGVGGHLTALRRTRIGPFSVSDASELDTIDMTAALLSPTDAASLLFSRLELTEQQAVDLGHGKRIEANAGQKHIAEEPGLHAAVAPSGRLVGLVEFRGKSAKSVVNFPADESSSGASAEKAVIDGGAATSAIKNSAVKNSAIKTSAIKNSGGENAAGENGEAQP